jgi:hypothetical protein
MEIEKHPYLLIERNQVRGAMKNIVFEKYKDTWILSSSEQAEGGLTLDAPPVRIIEHDNCERLRSVIEELLAEPVPVVPDPDEYDPKALVGIRAEAVGLNSWPKYVNNARCFSLEAHDDQLILEEWPKVGRSFNANAEWRKKFPPEGIKQLVNYLVKRTAPPKVKKTPVVKTKPSQTRRSKK